MNEERKSGLEKIADAYFRPKSFEKSGKLYEKLGIKQFKKVITYMAKLGLYPINKLMGREKDEKPDWSNNYFLWDKSVEGLQKFDVATRITEGFHTFLEIPLATHMILNIAEGDINGILYQGIGLLGNTYCMMLQRYNRSRLYNTIERMEGREEKLK